MSTEISEFNLEKSDLNLGVIGNCSFNALINIYGRIVWCCLPRFDSSPMFCRLLGGDELPDREKGFFDVVIENFARSEQRYLPNTAVLETKLIDTFGNIVEIIDLAPRFFTYGRIFCPTQFIRLIRNAKGTPRVVVRVRPVSDYGRNDCYKSFGTNHISYYSTDFNARLTTDVPIDFIQEEIFFVLKENHVMFFGNDETIKGNIKNVANDFFINTVQFWKEFTKDLHLPLEWQPDVIRAAITLKMCQVQSSGAIVAAMTSSIPESSDSKRNWDYRFCWLRDSYHIIQGLNRLGATCTMENYINFITNIVPKTTKDIQPLYGILMETQLDEKECNCLKGYRGQGPVRMGNDAYRQIQNDNFGNIILSFLLIFYDERLHRENFIFIFQRMELLGEEAVQRWDKKDSGLWELRNTKDVHTFSSVMCWVCCDRLQKIAKKIGFSQKACYWKKKADYIHKEIMEKAWDEDCQSFMATLHFPGEEKKRELDASVLMMANLKFIEETDEKFVRTVHTIEKSLVHDGFCFRYVAEDDFGFPENSFIICTLWLIEALHYIGEKEKARKMFTDLLKCRNHVGLFSEDINHKTKELWGNFPQAYSMVGIINTAITLSDSWQSVGF